MWFRGVGLSLTFIVSLLAAPLIAEAQQQVHVPRIGVLSMLTGSPADLAKDLEAFRQGLHDLGYVEGQTIVIEYRLAEEQPERLPVLAAELVQLPVDVLVARGAPATQGAKQVTSTLPIVMVSGGTDPGWGAGSSPAWHGPGAT